MARSTAIPNEPYYGGGIGSQGTMTLIGGRFENNQADSGGGIWGPNAALTLTNVVFVGNTSKFGAGGGILAWGPVNVVGGRFENNTAKYGNGGGIQAGVLIISRTIFTANTAYGRTSGGGAFAYDMTIITDSLFEYNHAMEGNGGGLVANNLVLMNTTFLSNTATAEPFGGAAGWGGGVFAGTATLAGNHFEYNTAYMGGGLFANGAQTLSNTEFISNFASFSGGGLYLIGDLVLSNTMFVGNMAPDGGGLVQEGWYGETPSAYIANAVFARNRASENGAALYLFSGGNAVVLHTTIVDEGLNSGRAVVVSRATIAGITDTVITSHTIGIVQDGGTECIRITTCFSVTPLM